eukprot:366475-Chlamydomonas_euryale.AAC.5
MAVGQQRPGCMRAQLRNKLQHAHDLHALTSMRGYGGAGWSSLFFFLLLICALMPASYAIEPNPRLFSVASACPLLRNVHSCWPANNKRSPVTVAGSCFWTSPSAAGRALNSISASTSSNDRTPSRNPPPSTGPSTCPSGAGKPYARMYCSAKPVLYWYWALVPTRRIDRITSFPAAQASSCKASSLSASLYSGTRRPRTI